MKADACMYTLYHMLSFILFIVPIFLIYLLPRFSPNTSSCSFRLYTAGYQKRGGQESSTMARGTVSQHHCLSVFQPWCALLEEASWWELRDAWVCQCLNCDFSSTSGLKRYERGGLNSMLPMSALLVEWPWWDGAGGALSHSQGCVAVKIKGNSPLGIRFW